MDAIKINLKKPTKTQKLKQAICQHEKLGTFTQTDIYWHVNGTMCADCQKVFKLNIRARTEKIYS